MSVEGSQVSDHGVGPGSVVAGRFRLEDLLEEADGARFWRATDLTLARDVAVHVLASSDPRAPAALTAARTSALVSDPHILRVLDAVEQEDVVFLVHEWGNGVSLDLLLADDVLDGKRAAWLVREVAQGIVAGHTMGVAHGRLIPENVMINEAGSVKLIGFVVGGVLHGRPEALPDGRPAPSEHESDVLNLGALLYACLTGRWPGFPGSTLPPAPTEHGRPLRPRRVRAGVPKYLDSVCQDVFAGTHGRESQRPRYESAAAVAEALSRYLGDGGGALPVVNALTEVGGPTAFVDPNRAPGQASPDTPGSTDPEAEAEAAPSADTDPEATQAAFALEDSAPGRAVLRAHLTDSAEARAQVDTEERSFDRATSTTQVAAARPLDEEERERTRMAREALGRRSDRGGAESGDHDLAGASRAPLAAAALPSSTGSTPPGATRTRRPHETGPPPAAVPWGPDPYPTGAQPAVTGRRDKPGALALRLAAVVALLVVIVVGVLLAFNLGSSRTADDPAPPDDGTGATPASQRLRISQVLALDPPSQGGNGEENDADAPAAADGDPATAWRTETYFDGPVLAPYKQGVGLVVDLGQERQVGQVALQLVGSGYDVAVLAAQPGASAPPDDIAGLENVGRERGTVGEVTVEADVSTRYLVVWLRALSATEGGYAGQVAEIVVRS